MQATWSGPKTVGKMKLFKDKSTLIMLLPALLITAGLSIYAVTVLWMRLGKENSPAGILREIVSLPSFWESLGFSLGVTAVSAVLSLGIGVAASKLLFGKKRSTGAGALFWVPMAVPHFVGAYLVIWFFSQSGWAASLTQQLGLIDQRTEFPILTNDRGGIGIILSYVWKEIPFVILMTAPVYLEMNNTARQAVATLGGGAFRKFKDAEWPYLKAVTLETGVILFAFVFGAFEVPGLVGATRPEMIGVTIFEWYSGGNWEERPYAYAVSACIGIIFIALSALLMWYTRRLRIRIWRRE